MFRRFLIVLALLAAPLCALPATASAATQTAVFAGGCFWCMENDMRGIPGVVKVESGYTGGHVKNPTYRDVTSERSGHYEAVRVTYDPAKIEYAYLLSRYWKLVDPTDDGGQFCDRGPSYRPAVFVDAQQRPVAERSRALAAQRLKTGTMKAQILPLQTFWPAEAYHRDYARNNAVEYHLYRTGCGRDRRLTQVWGK
ncbi:peptide-methionine (S)-S-oxide reductase [Caulobacter flavus]|uniref:Peptide methionine sulfoxide reductase MsrA n=1 Tax=Caulobacter flavus TaxID=1679497 RepID=A0A2N5CMH2_9CAUL|nr:peptide-methionine (S)-S-oxide reductase MsrA [Caulobacter flavus]AYV44822.1 peptide-methionine (S)-S-oxide reductase [Caulobacter flavus]PLR07162.1 peptide-methionine (S)-S-oxide reductase [Caulobacter flavus]